MRLSKRVNAIQPSATLAIAAKAKALKAAGEKVFAMAAGEPDFATPEPIRAACVRALEAGHTGYAPAAGIPELRETIIEKVNRELDVEYGDDQVVVGLGAKQCLFNAMQALLDPGDRALIQTPYWVSYPPQVTLAGGQVALLPMADEGFGLNRQALADCDPAGLRLMIINSPSNPSGHVLSNEDLDALADFARSHDLFIVTDDIYDQLTYSAQAPAHILIRHPDLIDRTLVVNGVSKAYSMTGWRLGYALGPKALIAAMRKLQDQSTSNAVTFVQHAAVTALRSPPEMVGQMRAAFKNRRDLLVARLDAISGVECACPDGSFYAFPSFVQVLGRQLGQERIDTTLQLSEQLLEKERVATVPGEAFGAPGYIRFSFACSEDDISEAVTRVGRLLESLE